MYALSDEDIARETLAGCKLMSDVYTDAALESADPALMDLFDRLHHEHIGSAHRVWEWLNRHGAYPVRQAGPREADETRRFLDQLVRETAQFCHRFEHAEHGSAYADPYPRESHGGHWTR